MQTCCICLEDSQILITPKHCSCKIYLHEECLQKIHDIYMLCPICRKQKNIEIPNNHIFINTIIELPFYLFEKYPSFFTFLLTFISSWIFALFIIVPYILLCIIRFYGPHLLNNKKYCLFLATLMIGSISVFVLKN